jgi:hypothetical protein
MAVGVLEHERHLQRMPLWRRQPGKQIIEHRLEQITEHGERELRLGLDRACRQHAEPALARRLDARLPERGLANSGLAGESQRCRARVERRNEAIELCELLVSADHVGPRRCGHRCCDRKRIDGAGVSSSPI